MKIRKAPGAETNTFKIEIEGMSINPQTLKGQRIKAMVMFTSDTNGETLSIFDPTTKKQIVIPFEDVDRLIEHVRQNVIFSD